MEKDADAGGGAGRREGRTEETSDPGSRKCVEERKKPTCGSHLPDHTHLSEWAESSGWVRKHTHTHTVRCNIYSYTWNGFITWADWHISVAIFLYIPLYIPFFLAVSHPHTVTDTLSVFVPHIHPQLQPTLRAFRKWCHVSNTHHHPLPSCQPTSHTQIHTDRQCFFVFLLVQPFLSKLYFCAGQREFIALK